MAHFETFEEVEIYQLARVQCRKIWHIIITTSLQKDYKLRDQIYGSSGSVMDNIAEGFGRGGNKEFIQFLSYSRGSNNETKAQLQRCLDRNHISEETFKALYRESEIVNEQISKFMNYLKKSDRKGFKYE